jgi:hypothetical protein
MPDMTIPAALFITIGAIFCAGHAFYTGDLADYRSAAIVGLIGTFANMVFFYRRLNLQIQAERRQVELQKKKQDETKAA